MQNDDWNRTTTIVRFLSGDFTLLPRTATTYYTQGFMGYVWALIFGWKKLPILTLIVSVLNFYVFALIVHKFFNLEKIKALVISLVLFFTPLHMYSSIGFMTENYTLFFMLLSIYFLLQYEKTNKYRDLALFNISGVLSFFTKQNGVIIQAASIPYFIFKKKYKEALVQIVSIAVLLSYYYLFFPRTHEMYDKGFIIKNLNDSEYVYSLIYGIILVSVSYVLPFVLYFVISTYVNLINPLKLRKTLVIVVIALASSFFCFKYLNQWFIPGKISWEEYPYFENTFERSGFFPSAILGTKYLFRWNYDLYKYWDLASKVLLALALPRLILNYKKLINVYSISIVGYIILMVFVKTFYDRYLLPLIPLFILMLLYMNPSNLIFKYIYSHLLTLFIIPFLLTTLVLSTEMVIDFVLTNNYIWTRSEQLVKKGVPPDQIRATMAWLKVYDMDANHQYMFSFSSFENKPKYLKTYTFIEEKDLSFPGSIFINPKVYLYKKK